MGQHGSTSSERMLEVLRGRRHRSPCSRQCSAEFLSDFFWVLLETTILQGLHFTTMNLTQKCQTLQQT